MKRLKNIEGKNKDQLDEIEYQGKTQLDAIEKQGKKNLEAISKQEKQLQKIKNKKKEPIKRVEKEEGSRKTVLLRDGLKNILQDYGEINITAKGEDILKKLANDERMINYENLFFKIGNPSIDNYHYLKRFSSLYDFFYDLISETISIKKAAKEQNEMIKK